MDPDYEIVIVGGGPAGMQAAISAATDGISCVVLEKHRLGGAIRATPRLENVAFVPPGGWTGIEFVTNMIDNAEFFDVEFIQPANVRALEHEGDIYRVHYAVGDHFDSITARFVILALGTRWKPIHAKGITSGIHDERIQYGPTGADDNWEGKSIVVVGGGPAAGQCIVDAAATADTACVLLREGWSCPKYLLDRIHYLSNVTVHLNVSIEEFDQDGYVRYSLPPSSSKFNVQADKVFLCAGVQPETSWLKHSHFALTEGGYLQTLRPSYMTDVENVFAIGDCRDGSTARVCAALGDGSACITEIHAIRNKAPVLSHKDRK